MGSTRWPVVLIFVFFAVGQTAAAFAADPNGALSATRIPSDADKSAFILETMQGGGIPGLQTIVVKNGKVVWRRSYGYSVLARPGPLAPMRDDSLLFSASVAKMITVTA